MQNLRRNKNQTTQTPSQSNYRHRQIRGYKRRINDLEKALRELINEMTDRDMIKKYQEILDAPIPIFKPLKKTSNFRGVSWYNPKKLWRSRTYPTGCKEVTTYHKTELAAALAYDEKVKEYHPNKPHLLNFIPEGKTQEDMKKPPDILAKRKFIGKHLDNNTICEINPMGVGYLKVDQADLLLQFIEKTQGLTIR